MGPSRASRQTRRAETRLSRRHRRRPIGFLRHALGAQVRTTRECSLTTVFCTSPLAARNTSRPCRPPPATRTTTGPPRSTPRRTLPPSPRAVRSAGPPSSRASPSPPRRFRFAILAVLKAASFSSSSSAASAKLSAPVPPQPRRSVRRGGRQQLVHRVHAHAAHPVLVPGEDGVGAAARAGPRRAPRSSPAVSAPCARAAGRTRRPRNLTPRVGSSGGRPRATRIVRVSPIRTPSAPVCRCVTTANASATCGSRAATDAVARNDASASSPPSASASRAGSRRRAPSPIARSRPAGTAARFGRRARRASHPSRARSAVHADAHAPARAPRRAGGVGAADGGGATDSSDADPEAAGATPRGRATPRRRGRARRTRGRASSRRACPSWGRAAGPRSRGGACTRRAPRARRDRGRALRKRARRCRPADAACPPRTRSARRSRARRRCTARVRPWRTSRRERKTSSRGRRDGPARVGCAVSRGVRPRRLTAVRVPNRLENVPSKRRLQYWRISTCDVHGHSARRVVHGMFHGRDSRPDHREARHRLARTSGRLLAVPVGARRFGAALRRTTARCRTRSTRRGRVAAARRGAGRRTRRGRAPRTGLRARRRWRRCWKESWSARIRPAAEDDGARAAATPDALNVATDPAPHVDRGESPDEAAPRARAAGAPARAERSSRATARGGPPARRRRGRVARTANAELAALTYENERSKATPVRRGGGDERAAAQRGGARRGVAGKRRVPFSLPAVSSVDN